jgi:erythromycin esterase-like protein
MTETLVALGEFLGEEDAPARMVVWAHNSHLGDARETEMGERGEQNVGQLVRQWYGRDVVNIGFSTYAGTVTAASDWGTPARRMRVRPALPGSYEELFHTALPENFALVMGRAPDLGAALAAPRLQRAIGVIYRPETERLSHYFHASLARQFDVLLHYDTTRAVEPLEPSATWTRGEHDLPETYPSAL